MEVLSFIGILVALAIVVFGSLRSLNLIILASVAAFIVRRDFFAVCDCIAASCSTS